MQRLVFIVEFGFFQRDFDRFGFKFFKENHVDVFVLDLSSLLRPEYLKEKETLGYKEIENYQAINSWDNLERSIETLDKQDLVVCMVETNSKNQKLFSLLNQNSIKYGFWFFGELPSPFNFLNLLTQSNLIDNLKKIVKRILRFINKPIKSIYSPEFVMVAGRKSSEKAIKSFPNSDFKLIQSHSFDYDRFLHLRRKPKSKEVVKEYFVFLDEDKAFHPDYLIADPGRSFDSEDYFREVNDFFYYLEKIYNKEVIIAAHPKASYNVKGNPFKQRKIETGITIDLIKNSSLVLGHSSTALGLAVMYNKPILLIDSDMFPSFDKKYVKAFSKALGAKVINISKQPFKDSDILENEINLIKYRNYIRDYIKGEESPESFSWEIFFEEVKSL